MRMKVIGHRGARGMFPELSLFGIQQTLDLGVDAIEIDVGITADKKVVAYHDYELNPDITRTRDGRWLSPAGPPIYELTLDQLRQLDIGAIDPHCGYHDEFPHQRSVDGARIPTLEEIVGLVQMHAIRTPLWIEAKRNSADKNQKYSAKAYAKCLLDEIHRLDFSSQCVIHSFDWDVLRHIHRLDPRQQICHLTSQLSEYYAFGSHRGFYWAIARLGEQPHKCLPTMIANAGGKIWSSDFQTLCRAAVAKAHELNLQVYAWTVNDVEELEWLAHIGVAGVVTDYPNRLLSFPDKLTYPDTRW